MGAFLAVDIAVNIEEGFLNFILAALAFGKPFTLPFLPPFVGQPLIVVVWDAHFFTTLPNHAPKRTQATHRQKTLTGAEIIG
jgi:hypothetical protein